MHFYDLYDAKNAFSKSELTIFGFSGQFSTHQKMPKIGRQVKGLTFTFWLILAIFWSAEKCLKMHFYDLYDAKNACSKSEMAIFVFSGQFSVHKKMPKIGQKVKVTF